MNRQGVRVMLASLGVVGVALVCGWVGTPQPLAMVFGAIAGLVFVWVVWR